MILLNDKINDILKTICEQSVYYIFDYVSDVVWCITNRCNDE